MLGGSFRLLHLCTLAPSWPPSFPAQKHIWIQLSAVLTPRRGHSPAPPAAACRARPLPCRPMQVVVPLQVINDLAIIILDETTPAAQSWFT